VIANIRRRLFEFLFVLKLTLIFLFADKQKPPSSTHQVRILLIPQKCVCIVAIFNQTKLITLPKPADYLVLLEITVWHGRQGGQERAVPL